MAKWSMLLFGLLAVSWEVGSGEKTEYDDHMLLRLTPTSKLQLDAVHLFSDPEGQVEVLKRSRDVGDSFDVVAPPNATRFLHDFAELFQMPIEVKHTNYGRTFENVNRLPRRRVLKGLNIFGYNSFATIQEYLENTARKFPDLVTLQPVGSSFEGRRMKLVRISSQPQAGNPVIFIDAGIHAREWVAPAMALYIIHRLTNDPDARTKELNGVDWFILPVVNPDGYEYTRSSRSNRLWRKTRSQTNRYNCFGVDGNRNYGYKWGVSGISNNPCDRETYAGPKPFSEPETKIVKYIMTENADRLKLYVSMHSYGQYLVYPWGYTGDFLPKEWKSLDSLARQVSEAVVRAGGRPFRVMSAGKWYPAAGGSDDYAFGAIGVPYSYTMELTDGHEFQFPESLLKTVLPQFYEGFKAFGAQIKREFNSRVKREV